MWLFAIMNSATMPLLLQVTKIIFFFFLVQIMLKTIFYEIYLIYGSF
jgi:hypothetical protein